MSARGGGGAIALLLVAIVLLLADLGGGDETGGGATGGGGVETSTPADGVRAEVERVIDGDTIEVSLAGGTEDVRYIGVDTPETVKPGRRSGASGPRPPTATTSSSRGGP